MRLTKHCAIWCGRAKMPSKTSIARGNGSESLCCGTEPNRPLSIKKKWTAKYMTWLNTHVHFGQPALTATLVDYVHEVHHAGERIARLLLLRSVSGQRNYCLVIRARSHKTNRHMQSTPAAWVDS
jgi:hypothetical protein